MIWISDRALTRLKSMASLPDLAGTGYRMISEAGHGGMGIVYEVEDPALSRRVALKVLDLPDPSGELSWRLMQEARILAQLEHPGIVPVHDVGTLADGRVFYTMKLVQGDRLDHHIGRLRGLPERLRLFQRICEPVAFAHARGILHRDLKPQNVMIGPFGEVLVIDWGVAKLLSAPSLPEIAAGADAESLPPDSERTTAPGTQGGTMIGTPGYMPPEQATGDPAIDRRADIYSLGAILRFLVSAPVSGDTPRGGTATAATVHLAPPLSAIIAKAMAPRPDDRYAAVQDLAADVARLLDGEPVTAYPEGWWRKGRRLLSKHRTAVILVLAYLLMRILLLFWIKR